MPSINLTRTGQLNGNTADDRAAFYTLATSEVIAAFNQACVFKNLTMTRNLKRGQKSVDFPVLGRKKARYFTPGSSVLDDLNNSPNDRSVETVKLDSLMIAPEVIDDIDELMDLSAPQVRQEITLQLGQALADERDARTARVIFACSKRTTPQLQKPSDSNRVGTTRALSAGYANATKTSKGDELVSVIGDIKVTMKRKSVPFSEMVCVVGPEEYEFLQESSRAIHADFNSGNGANGTIRDGAPNLRIKGLPIYESNFINQEPYTLQPGDRGNTEYAQDMTKCRGLIFHKSCVGVLSLLAPQFQMTAPNGDFNWERQASGILAKMLIGMRSLRPEAAASFSIP